MDTAHYGAVYSALQATLQRLEQFPITLGHMMDVGAGTGAAGWAASELLPLAELLCFEKQKSMYTIGKNLMRKGPLVLQKAGWEQFDLERDAIPAKKDLVVSAYVLNELPVERQLAAAEKLWSAADQVLLLVEPGTPEGALLLGRVREHMVKCGAYLLSPCMSEQNCPLGAGDWCHFSCRIARSQLHRRLKGGDAPFEDEKFSYLALVRFSVPQKGGRVLRHPQIGKGFVTLEICTGAEKKTVRYSKKDGAIYKNARKAKSGDWFLEI